MVKVLERLDQILARVGDPAYPASLHGSGTLSTFLTPIDSHSSHLGVDCEKYENLSDIVPEPLGTSRTTGSVTGPTSFPHIISADEMSKDYLRIPSSNTTADSILTWPIFQSRFLPEYLTETLMAPTPNERDEAPGSDAFVVQGGFEPLSDERIPFLIDKFLENVHTKNPILDVEALLLHARTAAANGPGWDAPSCLVLLACALGSIAVPFESSVADRAGGVVPISSVTSSSIHRREIRQAESCYSLACRRLGLLKHTVLGAQCYFYSAGTASEPHFFSNY